MESLQISIDLCVLIIGLCVLQAVRSLSLFGPGFVELTPWSISQETELMFTFSSRNQSGLLLAALSHDKQVSHINSHRRLRVQM